MSASRYRRQLLRTRPRERSRRKVRLIQKDRIWCRASRRVSAAASSQSWSFRSLSINGPCPIGQRPVFVRSSLKTKKNPIVSVRVASDENWPPIPNENDCGVVTVVPLPNLLTALGKSVLKLRPGFRLLFSSTTIFRVTLADQSDNHLISGLSYSAITSRTASRSSHFTWFAILFTMTETSCWDRAKGSIEGTFAPHALTQHVSRSMCSVRNRE